MTIDDLDKRIMNVLMSDSRLSYRKIAQKTGVSVATIMNRVNRLEKAKVIKGYTAMINYEELGYDIDVMISINVSKGKLFQVENKISVDENVLAVYDVTGDFDSVVIAKFKNRRMLDSYLKKIQTYDFVESTNTVMILNVIKNKQIML